MAMPGAKKPAGSGRRKGTPNRNVLPLIEKAQKLGIDPFEILLLFANGDAESLGYPACKIPNSSDRGLGEANCISIDQRLKAASEACQYLYPKRKAIESTANAATHVDRPLMHLSDEELDAL
jgi:hypothetical protein